ncbi:uncharacterized protein MAM_02517 [Metarhizium album ARSEF 1941]|uniref:Secreted protein n=1 Tax=Metarhizium album (strain ARSEF 1941) TaxID=1081103 RepID=A0A0B2X1B5_METAS|nr:uncharacterized protein MAM_02517 [Metarhizium album ARSEF 1941]KHN99664.1 hypothetical protein MAM_02517 [Metarhizium album ARSEF 1941]
MKPSTVAAILCSATAVSASPVEKRAVGGVLLCTGANSTGTCKYRVYELDKCQQLWKPFYQNTNTFAVDGENFHCYPTLANCTSICTSPTGCTFGAVDYNYEHKYNLSAIGWDKYITSFRCSMK